MIIMSYIWKVYLWYSFIHILIIDVVFLLGMSMYTPYRRVISYNDIKKSAYPSHASLLSESWYDIWAICISLILAYYTFLLPVEYLRYALFLGLILIPLEVYIFKKYQKSESRN